MSVMIAGSAVACGVGGKSQGSVDSVADSDLFAELLKRPAGDRELEEDNGSGDPVLFSLGRWLSEAAFDGGEFGEGAAGVMRSLVASVTDTGAVQAVARHLSDAGMEVDPQTVAGAAIAGGGLTIGFALWLATRASEPATPTQAHASAPGLSESGHFMTPVFMRLPMAGIVAAEIAARAKDAYSPRSASVAFFRAKGFAVALMTSARVDSSAKAEFLTNVRAELARLEPGVVVELEESTSVYRLTDTHYEPLHFSEPALSLRVRTREQAGSIRSHEGTSS